MKYHALFIILKKRQNLKLSSAANNRWHFKGKHPICGAFRVECCFVLLCIVENIDKY